MKALSLRFVEESSLELHSFLCDSFASKLQSYLPELDAKEGLGPSRGGLIPPHHAGTTSGAWTIKGPPHKWRYCVLQSTPLAEAVTPRTAYTSADAILRCLQDELFSSQAFRAWVAIVSNVLPLGYSVEARRFRPGLDYTLATSEEKEARLDLVLGLTPEIEADVEPAPSNSRAKRTMGVTHDQHIRGWQSGDWGGWEACKILRDMTKIGLRIFNSVTWRPITKRMTQQSIGPVPAEMPMPLAKLLIIIHRRHLGLVSQRAMKQVAMTTVMEKTLKARMTTHCSLSNQDSTVSYSYYEMRASCISLNMFPQQQRVRAGTCAPNLRLG
jgi:hypothetical protein